MTVDFSTNKECNKKNKMVYSCVVCFSFSIMKNQSFIFRWLVVFGCFCYSVFLLLLMLFINVRQKKTFEKNCSQWIARKKNRKKRKKRKKWKEIYKYARSTIFAIKWGNSINETRIKRWKLLNSKLGQKHTHNTHTHMVDKKKTPYWTFCLKKKMETNHEDALFLLGAE